MSRFLQAGRQTRSDDAELPFPCRACACFAPPSSVRSRSLATYFLRLWYGDGLATLETCLAATPQESPSVWGRRHGLPFHSRGFAAADGLVDSIAYHRCRSTRSLLNLTACRDKPRSCPSRARSAGPRSGLNASSTARDGERPNLRPLPPLPRTRTHANAAVRWSLTAGGNSVQYFLSSLSRRFG